METMTDATLAKHKGLLVPELINKRMVAQRRIRNLLVLSEYLDWCQGRTQPWHDGYGDTELAEVVDNLCRNHWPYNVDDLGWRVRHVAFTLHKPSVDLFLSTVGKNVNWFDVIELGLDEIQGIVKLFKAASAKSRNQHGKSKSQVQRSVAASAA